MQFRGRPLVSWLLVGLLGQLSFRALVGGGSLLVVPSGDLVGVSTHSLRGSPFVDFFVPGLILVVVFGLYPIVVCYGLYVGRQWGWLKAASVGVALFTWILVEVAVGFDRPTQYLNLGTAVGILALSVHPSIRHPSERALS